jgi:hypothetical protein
MNRSTALRRAYISFGALTAVAILLVGALSTELAATPSHLVGTAVALTGLTLALVLLQLWRVMVAIDRATVSRPRRTSAVMARIARRHKS